MTNTDLRRIKTTVIYGLYQYKAIDPENVEFTAFAEAFMELAYALNIRLGGGPDSWKESLDDLREAGCPEFADWCEAVFALNWKRDTRVGSSYRRIEEMSVGELMDYGKCLCGRNDCHALRHEVGLLVRERSKDVWGQNDD